jgi:regulator of replication initiation timing
LSEEKPSKGKEIFVRTNTQNFGNSLANDYSDWPEYISTEEAIKALGLSRKELRNILNAGDIETNQEEKREEAFRKWDRDELRLAPFRYFDFVNMENAKVHTMSMLNYAQKKGISFNIKSNGMTFSYKHVFKSKDEYIEIIFSKQNEIDQLKKTVQSLKAENATLQAGSTGKRPKTANATHEKYKRYIAKLREQGVQLVRLACELGRRGLKGSQPWKNADLEALAGEMGISFTENCFKVLKEGLPDELVRKSPGAPPLIAKE